MIILKTLVSIRVTLITNFSFRCSGSQIQISIMKSVSEDQCECFSIYDHDDLTHLDIEIHFLKKSFLNRIWAQNWLLKSALKKSLRKLVRKMKFEIFFNGIRFFYLDAFWYDDWYWKASPGSTLNDFNNGLTIFYDLSSFFNKISASCKFSLKSWNSNFFFQKTKIDV